MYTSGTMPLTNWAHPENSTIEMLIKRLKLHTLLSFLVSMYENFEYSKHKWIFHVRNVNIRMILFP